MFRLKALPIVQNIIYKNVYDTIHKNIIQCTLFSTNTLNQCSDETSINTSNENSELNISGTLREIIDKNLTKPSVKSTDTTTKLDKLYKKVEIEVRGNEKAVLESYGQFAVMAATHLGIHVCRNVSLKKAIHERYTLLKSANIYKKHRVQYETRTYYRYLDFQYLTGSTADTFLEYIQRNLPEGVAMKVTMVELQTLPKTVKQATPLK